MSSSNKKRLMDPSAQTEEERKRLRKAYRILQKKTLEEEKVIDDFSNSKLIEHLDEQNILFKKGLGVEQCRKFGKITSFSPLDLCKSLITLYPNKENELFRNGAMEIESKKRKTPQHRVIKEKFDVKRPEVIKDISIDEKTQTDARVKNLDKLLPHENTLIPFWEFVLNKSSFSQTAENIFDLTFLIKEGRARLYFPPESDILCIERRLPPTLEDMSEGLVPQQNIITFNHQTFQFICQQYPESPLHIPSRL